MRGEVGVSGNGKFVIVCYERFVEASGVTLKICLGRGQGRSYGCDYKLLT